MGQAFGAWHTDRRSDPLPELPVDQGDNQAKQAAVSGRPNPTNIKAGRFVRRGSLSMETPVPSCTVDRDNAANIIPNQNSSANHNET